MLTPRTLFLAQILAHVGFVTLVAMGTWWQWLIAVGVYFVTGCLGVTVTYHRLLSHKAWSASPIVAYIGTLFATVGLIGSAVSWVALHRQHHRFADTEKDPHAPSIKGFIRCHWLSMFEPVDMRYAVDLGKRRFFQFQHKYYFLICLLYVLVLAMAVEPFAIVYAFLAPACILWNAAASIVTFSHLFGSKDHELTSEARNHWLLGVFVWGEGWHNNHHANPNSPYFAEKPWQIDIGGYLIWIYQVLPSTFNFSFKVLAVEKGRAAGPSKRSI